MDRLSDFKLSMGVVIKADKDWRDVWRPQVAMHSQLPRFLVYYYLMQEDCIVQCLCTYVIAVGVDLNVTDSQTAVIGLTDKLCSCYLYFSSNWQHITRDLAIANRPCNCCRILKSGSYTKAV